MYECYSTLLKQNALQMVKYYTQV